MSADNEYQPGPTMSAGPTASMLLPLPRVSFGPLDTDDMPLALAERVLTICKTEHPQWFAVLMLKAHGLPTPHSWSRGAAK